MKKIAVVCLLVSLFSCHSYKDIDVSLNVMAKGNLHGDGREGISAQNTMITSAEKWDKLKTKLKINRALVQKLDTISIDFDKQMVIALFDKQRRTGGHQIFIGESLQGPKEIVFTVKTTHPDGVASMVMTQPFYLATIPKTDKPISFKEAE